MDQNKDEVNFNLSIEREIIKKDQTTFIRQSFLFTFLVKSGDSIFFLLRNCKEI